MHISSEREVNERVGGCISANGYEMLPDGFVWRRPVLYDYGRELELTLADELNGTAVFERVPTTCTDEELRSVLLRLQIRGTPEHWQAHVEETDAET